MSTLTRLTQRQVVGYTVRVWQLPKITADPSRAKVTMAEMITMAQGPDGDVLTILNEAIQQHGVEITMALVAQPLLRARLRLGIVGIQITDVNGSGIHLQIDLDELIHAYEKDENSQTH